jgi:D-beta-D-heptose 7-phosphate kinase / D-beta-D-heptose 1-phosphate adenosyltransferase
MRKLESKIKSLKELSRITTGLKKSGKRVVFTNGCFDILHYGHVKYLEDAKAKGDVLVVAVNSDASIKRIKGNSRPIVKERDRIRTIAALESVDYALTFEEDTPLKTITALKPAILVKGSDWKNKGIVGKEFILRLGGKVATVKLLPGRSTTKLIKKIAGKS